MSEKAVWKYELSPNCTLKIPIGAQILTVGYQKSPGAVM